MLHFFIQKQIGAQLFLNTHRSLGTFTIEQKRMNLPFIFQIRGPRKIGFVLQYNIHAVIISELEASAKAEL